MDEIDFPGIITSQDLFEIPDVRIGVEYFLEMIQEPRAIQFDRAKDLQGIALAGRRDFRLRADRRPSLVKGGILPEAGFVLEKDGRSFAFGFFLMSGYR